MSERINVEAILKKHTKSNPFYNGMPASGPEKSTDYKAAIKEIVELAIDKCKENASYELTAPWEEGVDREIDKNSIEQVKQLIDYE